MKLLLCVPVFRSKSLRRRAGGATVTLVRVQAATRLRFDSCLSEVRAIPEFDTAEEHQLRRLE